MKRVNPFTYGNPISDAARFVGRRREVEQIFSRLRNVEFESSSLVGERRIGKTSLLYFLTDPEVRRAHKLPPEEFIFVYVDLALLDAATTPARLWQYLLGQIVRHLADTDAASLRETLHESDTLDNFALTEFFDRLDAQKRHVVLLLDEFENVTRNAHFGADFFYGLRSLAIHHHLALITSSRRELIELTHSDEIRSSPFFNIFANINLRVLDHADAARLLHNALTESDIRFTASEIEKMLQVAGSHPFFLQVAAHFLFEAYTQELDAAPRETFWLEKFRAEATPHLQEYWRHTDSREKIVLAALAVLDPRGSLATNSVANLEGLAAFLSRSERILAQLEKRALVVSTGDTYEPFNGLFAEWIRAALDEHAPIDAAGQVTLAQALAQAIQPVQPPAESLLTPREIEVLRLVAQGLSDAQVAKQLVVSPRTVSTHLQSIYGKLGVNSRAAATRFALDQHLV